MKLVDPEKSLVNLNWQLLVEHDTKIAALFSRGGEDASGSH